MDLLYKVEFKEHFLIVRLEEQGSKRNLYLDSLKSLAKESDKEALALLVKIHLRSPNASRSADTLTFQQIEVPAASSYDALKLMSRTGRLFFQGKTLSLSSESAAKIYWKGEKHSEKSCTLSGVAQWKGKEIPLEACSKLFPGTPFWLIFEQRVIPISTELAWKWIELFLNGPLLLEGALKKKFLEEEPPLLWKESAPEKILEVFPELVLKDATGCFADLWMEYPGVGRVAFEDLAPSVGGKARLKPKEAEWEKDLLETGFIRKKVGDSNYYIPSERSRDGLLFLLELGWKIKDSKGRTVYKQSGFELDLREENEAILLQGQIHFGKEQGTVKSLMDSLEKKRMWVELNDQSIGLLDRKASAFSAFIEGEWKDDALAISKTQAAALLPFLDAPSVKWEENLKRMAEGLRELKGQASPVLECAPPDPCFKGTLLSYQQKGVDWLAFLHRWGFSGLLADEMGLGKTVQVLAFFSRLAPASKTHLPILIVVPTSLLFNWRLEVSRFLPDVTVYVHAGPHRLKKTSDLQKCRWILVSYAVLRLDEDLFSSMDFEAIALDESNAIKTAATQTAQTVFGLKGRFRIAMSGTPMENRPEEIWSQFRFLLPDLLGEKKAFQAAELESIRRKLRPFILRRRKEEVQIDLPEKIESVVWIEMDEPQRKVYDSYLSNLKSGLLKKIDRDGIQEHRMEVLEAILRLRQICCDPRLVGSSSEGAKVQTLLSELNEIFEEKRKVLVYSQFTSLLQLIATELDKANRTYLYLDGATSGEKRGELVQTFQEDPNASLFLLSLKAGGVGLNLTAADTVILMDPWWNEAVEKQAIDRAHRIGQKKTVIAKRYLIPGTIEEKILHLKAKKQSAADLLLDLEGDITHWTADDLLSLLI